MMMLRFVLTTLLAGAVLAGVPDYIEVCGRRNPNLNACVQNSVEKLKDKLSKGIPELDAPSLEPLTLNKLIVSDAPTFKATAQNVKLWGFPAFKVQKLNVDLKEQLITIDISFDTIGLEAEYDVYTRVVVPIVGKGPINIVAESVTAQASMKFNLVDHKGAKYLYFPSMTTKLNIKDYTSKFTPRGGSDGALAEGINSALSGSRQEIIETITPNLEKVISERVLELANRICKHFTYDELFPDRE